MFWMNMDPRGRKNGHRGFRPEIFASILALIFGGWIVIAVLAAVLGAGVMVTGSVFAGLARVLRRLLPVLLSSKSFVAGLLIGLIWSIRNRRNAVQARKEETREAADSEKAGEAQEEIIEPRAYRTFGA